MTTWSDPDALRAQVLRLWERDVLLEAVFPLRLVLRTPSSTELSESFDAVRLWAANLLAGARAGYRIETREVRHRVIGRNSLPALAWVDTLEDALRLIGKAREAKRLHALAEATRAQAPQLLPWLQQRPRRAFSACR